MEYVSLMTNYYVNKKLVIFTRLLYIKIEFKTKLVYLFTYWFQLKENMKREQMRKEQIKQNIIIVHMKCHLPLMCQSLQTTRGPFMTE